MRLLSTVLGAVALGLLVGCSGTDLSPGSSVPNPQTRALGASQPARPSGPVALEAEAPDVATAGLYVSEFSSPSILAYKSNNEKNRPPICTVPGVLYPNDIAVDGKGNLIDPDGGTRSVIIFKGPGMCGAKAATMSDPYGQPIDAASNDALTGTIAVANMFDNGSKPGSIAVCTAKGGCTSNLTNPGMYELDGVAMDKKGNCWASAFTSSFTPTLTYFAKCKGAGLVASGYRNTSYGGLDIDKAGNLVAIDSSANNTGQVFVYSGCNPACKLVSGPFALHGEAFYGHLNQGSTMFATANFTAGQIDIYRYSTRALTYLYSFNNGLTPSFSVKGAAYNPRSKE